MDAIDIAIQAAHQAGELILRHFRQPQEIHRKGPADIVTQVDRDAEDVIVGVIRNAFPDHEFLGEEEHRARHGADHVWVIDPLDGTRNYAVGIPFFCTSISLAVEGLPVLGVVYDPLHGETFSAQVGKGACLNGARIRCARKSNMEHAVTALGFLPVRNPEDPGLAVPMLVRLRPTIEATRTMGSVALSLAYVGCGRFDIAYQDRLSAWDVLGGALLVAEGGGVVTEFTGKPVSLTSRDVIAAGAPAFHAHVLRIAQEVLMESQTQCEARTALDKSTSG